MFLTKSEYDRGVNTFSPEGRLFQVEYAIEAIKLGSTAIGIKTKEGVLLFAEKRIASTLIEASSVEKLVEIDAHVGCGMSGLVADARTMIDHARVEAQNHWFTFNEKMKVESIAQGFNCRLGKLRSPPEAVGDLALQFGEGSSNDRKKTMSRPFGVSLLIGGIDENGYHLFYTDPTGSFFEYDGKAMGSGCDTAQSTLQEHYKKDMTLLEAEILGIEILKQVMKESINELNIEVASITNTNGFKIYPKEYLVEIIKKIK